MYELLRICPRCKQAKSILEFSKDHSRTSGVQGWCKTCKNQIGKEYRFTHRTPPKQRKVIQKYFTDAERHQARLESMQKYHASLKGLLANRKYYHRNKDKTVARKRINTAIQYGRIIRSSNCQHCGIECKTEAHHNMGYSKENWYNVQWLCKKCHIEADKILKEMQV